MGDINLLAQACASQSLNKIKKLIKHNSTLPPNSISPTISATLTSPKTAKEKTELINFLWTVADPNDRLQIDNQSGLFPIHISSCFETVDLFRSVCDYKEEFVNLAYMLTEPDKNTVLHIACQLGSLDVVSFLSSKWSFQDFLSLCQQRNRKNQVCFDVVYSEPPVRGFETKPCKKKKDDDNDNEKRQAALHALLRSKDSTLLPRVFFHADCSDHLPHFVSKDEDEEDALQGAALHHHHHGKRSKRSDLQEDKNDDEEEEEVWEGPSRLTYILNELRELESKNQIAFVTDFPPCTQKQIAQVHNKRYVDFVFELDRTLNSTTADSLVQFSPLLVSALELDLGNTPKDTFFSRGSLKAATRAAGAVVAAIDCVVEERLCRSSMAIVRPPGHHAGLNGIVPGATSCGFCIFNNVMIGAKHFLDQHKKERVAVVDIDVHHGNGTEQIISSTFNAESILFVSTHLYDSRPSRGDFYPGGEFGLRNNVAKNIVNLPMRPRWRLKPSSTTPSAWQHRFYMYHQGRSGFRKLIQERVLPVLAAFDPHLLLISAGFDTARGDAGNCDLTGGGDDEHVSGFDLEREDFHWVAHTLATFARKSQTCRGVVSVLEGGYGTLHEDTTALDRAPLGRNVQSFVNGLSGARFDHDKDDDEDDELYFNLDDFFEDDRSVVHHEESAVDLAPLAEDFWTHIRQVDEECYQGLIRVLQTEHATMTDTVEEIKNLFTERHQVALLRRFNAFLPPQFHFTT